MKATNREKDRVETKETRLFCKQSVCVCAIANLLLKVTVFHELHLKLRCIALINYTKIVVKSQLVYTCDLEVATSALKKLH